MRLFAFGILAAALARAPLQCGRPPDPEVREYETPAEALYKLGERFKAQGDQAAWAETLRYLVERYPNDRYAKRAATELAGQGTGP